MKDIRADLIRLLEQDPPALAPIEGRDLVIYGAGGSGQSVGTAARARGWTVRAFLDARADSLREAGGVACHLPTGETARRLAAEGLPVVIGVFNFATDLRPIIALLKSIGFKRTVPFYQMHEELEIEPQFWLGRRSFYTSHRDEILAGLDLFGDETSRQIYHDHIALRLTFDTTLLAEPDQNGQYLPADLPPPSFPLRLIDGGAFNGDTVQLFVDQGVKLEAVAAFEPDAANFIQLRERIGQMNGRICDVILFPCGLSHETALRSFASGGGAASSIQAGGDTAIQVVALDDVLPTFAPNFIKLDIEGAEADALRGAAELISRFNPRLAVCVYHAPEHLWTLPRLIRELRPDYRLALRYHQYNGFDLVAYGFPA